MFAEPSTAEKQQRTKVQGLWSLNEAIPDSEGLRHFNPFHIPFSVAPSRSSSLGKELERNTALLGQHLTLLKGRMPTLLLFPREIPLPRGPRPHWGCSP